MDSGLDNYAKAFSYVQAYARHHNENLVEAIKIKNKNRFRGIVSSIEFEFSKPNDILIIRGFVDEYYIKNLNNGDSPNLRRNLPRLSEEQKKLFDGGYLELDETASVELIEDPEFPLRLNLRKDIQIEENYKVTEKDFIKMANNLSDAAYIFKKGRYIDFMKNGK